MAFMDILYYGVYISTEIVSIGTGLTGGIMGHMNDAIEFREKMENSAYFQKYDAQMDAETNSLLQKYNMVDSKDEISIFDWVETANPPEADLEEQQRKSVEESSKELEDILAYERKHDYAQGPPDDSEKKQREELVREMEKLEKAYDEEMQRVAEEEEKEREKQIQEAEKELKKEEDNLEKEAEKEAEKAQQDAEKDAEKSQQDAEKDAAKESEKQNEQEQDDGMSM